MVLIPPPDVIQRFRPQLIDFLQRLGTLPVPRSTLLTSWWRDAATNARVGGHPQSQHLAGLALDLVLPDAAAAEQLAAAVRAAGMVAVIESDHVHLQRYPAGFLASLHA